MLRISGLLSCVVLLGCEHASPPSSQANPEKAVPAATAVPQEDPASAARNHVQQYIDRLLGGDLSVQQGLLGIDRVAFGKMDHIRITSALPYYLPDGRPVKDHIRVMLHVSGTEPLRGKPISRDVELVVRPLDGRLKIIGSDL